jgi:transposase
LKHGLGVSERGIAISVGVCRSTVAEYLRLSAVLGMTWPLPESVSDRDLERRLFTAASFEEHAARPQPDWKQVHKELKRRGVTLLLLWEPECPVYRTVQQRQPAWMQSEQPR